ncbi:MAG: glucose-1-phosphate adenylyltransferase, partial [Planctomycetota bacterium]
EKEANRRRGVPDLGIGDGTIIENAILDKDCCIGEGVQIVNRDKVKNGEGKNFVIQEGIVVIPKGAVVEDGTII